MPEGEKFWNPYRWVEVNDKPIQHDTPSYRHQFSGISGALTCELENLTPLIIGDGKGQFVRSKSNNKIIIPATSLKGPIRSMAELIGNAAVPFKNSKADARHGLANSVSGSQQDLKLDCVARTYGHLNHKTVFAGLIQFSDATLIGDAPPQIERFTVVAGHPRPEHVSFYPDNQRRKFYHHHAGTTGLRRPHAGITQTNDVHAVTSCERFLFNVNFSNLREEELNLLLYCLILEEEVTVTLSPAALTSDTDEPVTLNGPLRHKIGGCKSQGGGSVHIHITRMKLRSDPASRYRGQDTSQVFDGDKLTQELAQRAESFRHRDDKTMQQLRAMLIYAPSDPRIKDINYPSRDWFDDDRALPTAQKKQLKTTL